MADPQAWDSGFCREQVERIAVLETKVDGLAASHLKIEKTLERISGRVLAILVSVTGALLASLGVIVARQLGL